VTTVRPIPSDPNDPNRITGAQAFYHLMAEYPKAWPQDRVVDVWDYLDRTFSKTALVVMADRAGLHTTDHDKPGEIAQRLAELPPHQLFSAFHIVYAKDRR